MLSAGIGFLGFGSHGLLLDACGFLIRDQAIPGIISKLATWATGAGACPFLSLSFVAFGLFMSWAQLEIIVWHNKCDPIW
jgi:hypothetical protein